ncbi:hypothetical protein COOONC_26278 [Cooperia oncophora]
MVRLLGIDFSPLSEPWDRKLESLGVAILSGMCKYNQWVMDYFQSDVHVTTYLPADRNYLMAAHPHGVICFGLYAAFVREFEGCERRNVSVKCTQ